MASRKSEEWYGGLSEIGWLESVLRRSGRLASVERVLSAEWEAAVPRGENFMSRMFRVRLRLVLGSGRTVLKSIIVKRLPTSDLLVGMIKRNSIFKLEIEMYVRVIPLMEELMEERGDADNKLWCRIIHCTPYSQLVLEDLKTLGFRMADKRKGLDLNEGLLAVRSLAKFHALSYALIEKGLLNVDCLLPWYFTKHDGYILHMIQGGMKKLAAVMKQTWEPSWATVAQNIDTVADDLSKRLLTLTSRLKTAFKVLIHGDFWTNNMMFRYNGDTGLPVEMRFLDFQGVNYNSPSMDLCFLIYSSLDNSAKSGHLNELLSAYCSSLRRNLALYGFEDARDVPSPDDLLEEFHCLGLVRLMLTCVFRPLTMSCEVMKDMEMSEAIRCREKGSAYAPYSDDLFSRPDVKAVIRKDLADLMTGGRLNDEILK